MLLARNDNVTFCRNDTKRHQIKCFCPLIYPSFSTNMCTTPIFSDVHFLCLQCHCPTKAASELKNFLWERGSTVADYFLRDLSFSISLTSDSLYEKISPSHLVTVRLLQTQISSATCTNMQPLQHITNRPETGNSGQHLRSTVTEHWTFAGELSLSCAWPATNRWPLMWVDRPLQVNQLGQLSVSSFQGW